MDRGIVEELLKDLEGSVEVSDGKVSVVNETKLRGEPIDKLVWKAVFGATDDIKAHARWLIWEIGQELGIKPSSINDLYLARGKGQAPNTFTVPALNLRALAYDSARAAFKAVNKLEVGAIIFEIARSEIGYTDQRPSEYMASVMAAAIKEGFRGPLFIQGDHFQVKRKKFFENPEEEVGAVKNLIREAMAAGFFNIDIDTSTLVDLSKEDLEEQQHYNYKTTAEILKFVREIEPEGITVSLGGEIGEIGERNSTPEDLEAFMSGLLKEIPEGVTGISKVAVQTGTTHGGVVLPDGSIAKVKVDFDTLRTLSRMAREKYGMGGAVQHGASTLPDEMFHKFPENETLEIHLATGFQNIIYDHLPEDLRNEAYQWLKENKKSEWKEGMTEEQFIYKSRKHAIGPFKLKFWSLPEDIKSKIRETLQKKFEFLFDQLNAKNTVNLVERFIKPVEIHKKPEDMYPGGPKESAEGLAD